MAPSTTTKIIEEFTNEYDAKVISWCDTFGKVIKW